MTRLPTRLLLLLALLGALWHPLCACTGALGGFDSSASQASCCAKTEQAPRTDPCGQPPGGCECERELVLASTEGEATTVQRLAALDLALAPLPLAFTGLPPVRSAPAPRATPPRPPDRCRPLPLRI